MNCPVCGIQLRNTNRKGICVSCQISKKSSIDHDIVNTTKYLNEHNHPSLVSREDILKYIYPNGVDDPKTVRKNISATLLKQNYHKYNRKGSIYNRS